MSENDTAEGSISRRTVLKGVGGVIATTGVSQVAAAHVPDSADMVEIPKGAQGEEVIRFKEVPRQFWNHLTTSRRVAQKLRENVDGAVAVQKIYSDDTIQGRDRRELVVLFPDEETRSRARVPSELEGVEISTSVDDRDIEPRNCEHTFTTSHYQGGQFGSLLNNYEDLGSCYDTGHGTRTGTLGCLAMIGSSDDRYILTSRHQYDPDETCNYITDRPAHAGLIDEGDGTATFYPTGHTTNYQSHSLDYMFLYNYPKECWSGDSIPQPISSAGRLYRQSDQIEIRGYTLNLDEEPQGSTFYNPSHKTGFNKAFIQGTDDIKFSDCTGIFGAGEFEHDNANGDSGSVYYKEVYDIEQDKTVAEISALLVAGSGSDTGNKANCVYEENGEPITDISYGLPAEQIQNDMNETVYFGGK